MSVVHNDNNNYIFIQVREFGIQIIKNTLVLKFYLHVRCM